jgi:protein-L-isoaspartate(D-aspartate) O-methyltransferase
MTQATETDDIASARQGLVAELRKMGMIKSAAVEDAFLAVPRHAFVPEGTPLTDTYDVDRSIAVKRDEHGVIVSSVSANYIQASMIEQADLSAGMRVLEIGSGGFNAALLAEVVGPAGHVVSVDIDADVTDRATGLLDAAGYGARVRVVLGDAEHGVPDEDPFDAIIVTVGAWDIAPAWLEQLKPGGRLVVPLRMNGISRSIGFRREGDHLESASVEVAGFVAMQGDGAFQERIFTVPDGHGHAVKLRFDTGAPEQPDLLDGVLATERGETWSGVMFGRSESFADLHLWFACFLPGFCFVAPDEDAAGLLGEPRTWFPFGTVHGDSLAYLAVRPAPLASQIEFGGRSFGSHGGEAAAAMVTQIQAWHKRHQLGAGPSFAYWPTGSRRPDQATGSDVAAMDKTHGTVTISWPAAS